MNGIYTCYHPVLKFALKHKTPVLSTALLLFILTSVIFARMGGEFVPSLDEGDIAMQTFLRPGSSLSETVEREKEVERLLLSSFPEIKTVCARIGVADIPTDPMGFDYTDSFIILEKDRSKWTSAQSKEELISKIKKKLSTLPGLNFSFSQPVELRFNELLTGIREDVAVKLYGEDLDSLNVIGERMEKMISRIPGAKDVALERTAGLPQITVQYNRKKLAQYGLSVDQLNQYVSAAFAGADAGEVFEGEKRFDMVIRLSDRYRKSIDDLKNLYVDLPNGSQIPLGEVAEISYQPGPMQISRDGASRRIYVGLNVRGRDVESVVSDIKAALDSQLRLPAGYRITYGGSFQNLQEAKARLGIVLPVALLLIFIMLYFALKSVSQALMIYIAVPMATIGGILALTLRGMPFSISAGVGFIVLFGVAVLNGLVLVNRLNTLKEEGISSIARRIYIGTQERLRPILLTALAAMLGFLPMAISNSAGAEVQRPLATVVIGGLFTATLLTLVVIPVLYALLNLKHKK
jgi:cobalt-zinc-cadmium resistance protein CzcA